MASGRNVLYADHAEKAAINPEVKETYLCDGRGLPERCNSAGFPASTCIDCVSRRPLIREGAALSNFCDPGRELKVCILVFP
jgi:hypothetical protein